MHLLFILFLQILPQKLSKSYFSQLNFLNIKITCYQYNLWFVHNHVSQTMWQGWQYSERCRGNASEADQETTGGYLVCMSVIYWVSTEQPLPSSLLAVVKPWMFNPPKMTTGIRIYNVADEILCSSSFQLYMHSLPVSQIVFILNYN